MDDLVKSILVQAPAVGVLLFALKMLYDDMKAEREVARQERQAMLDKIDGLNDTIDRQSIALARVERACGADLLPPSSVQKSATGAGS